MDTQDCCWVAAAVAASQYAAADVASETTRLCWQMQFGSFEVLLKATKSEVSLQKAISCLLLQRQQVAFMSRPLYPQQNQRRLKKSDISRDLPSKLRCEDKACLKVCFLLRSCSC